MPDRKVIKLGIPNPPSLFKIVLFSGIFPGGFLLQPGQKPPGQFNRTLVVLIRNNLRDLGAVFKDLFNAKLLKRSRDEYVSYEKACISVFQFGCLPFTKGDE